MFDFSGRVAVVTGASGALGGVVARRLLEAGAKVALIDRGSQGIASLLAVAGSDSARAGIFACELANAAAVERTIGEVLERFGRIDLVFNIAGAFRGGDAVESTSDGDWKLLWEANFLSALHVCRSALPRMKAAGGGAIVNVGSKASLAGGAGAAAYSVAKTAVLRLTESIAEEGKSHGVRANLVLPGTIDTPANRQSMPDADPSHWVAPDALADAILFLASDLARAVTGAALPVFGRG
jgi:NAD(P)-dependent dehydrogenase (short-subunit alcohol dehydrogenase family)